MHNSITRYYGVQYFLLLFLVLQILISCKTNTELVPKNMAMKYNPVQTELQPEIKIYQTSKEKTSVFVKFYTKDMGFEPDTVGNVCAIFDIQIRFYKNLNLTNLLDSVQKTLKFVPDSAAAYYQSEFSLNTPADKSFYFQIEIRDLNKNSRTEFFQELKKDELWSDNDFIIKNAEESQIRYLPVLKSGEKYSIQSEYFKPENGLLYYIPQDVPLAYPPFYGKPIPDLTLKSFKPKTLEYHNGFIVSAEKKGIYHLQADSLRKDGISMYLFTDYYPLVKTPTDLARALRYLTSLDEYLKIINASNLKVAVDSFWLSHNTEMNQAAAMIKEYYSRVEKANLYFTSFTEGWRTDRGMIFIMLGAPTNVFMYKDREVWRYGARLSLKYDEFIFWKIDNPFTDNHYLLERKISYKPLWYDAVESWRTGNIYRYTN